MAPLPTPSELLRRYGQPAKKKHGQNFLVDPNILDRIVEVAAIRPGDRVFEVGPGPGGLTTRLLHAGASVVVIETDDDLVRHLRGAFPADAPLEVVPGDALRDALPDWLDGRAAVVANLPYHVATPILMRLVDLPDPPGRMALMFQREVAERIAHQGAGRAFGPLAVAVQVRFRAELAMHLRPGAFRPAPKVRSAVVRLVRRPEPLATLEVERAARAVARRAFQQRRKMLRSSLAGLAVPDLEARLTGLGIDPASRPEALRLEDFLRMGEAFGAEAVCGVEGRGGDDG
ncbi:MAG: ribosomal RNA small subunit methyltransferase A [Deltaproteobacteria bacterium]|nr:MAG: ribosomal RNA small subunit methyltransferase A [Deltaproteobacteria bacterium]